MNKLIAFLLVFSALNSFSQKEANVWYFGRNAGINFNNTPPVALTDGKINTLEGCSSFSDAAGNLLFYSDGIKVFSKDHSLMTYTDGSVANNLKGNPSSTQSGMIIPKPGSTSIYYLFTVGHNREASFDLYTIDMSLNNGKGQLIDENGNGDFSENLAEQAQTNNTSVIKDNWTEKVAAVKGKACDSYWILTKVSNFFYAYKIDKNGVDLNPVVSEVNNRTDRTRGYLKISPNGKKIAIANQDESDQLILYSFNNDIGTVLNDGISIFNNIGDGEVYGIEFSRSSEKLYTSSVSGFREFLSDPETTYKIFQFDLTSSNIENSKVKIHEQVGYRGALQLGPDGKIYTTIPLAYDDSNGDATFLSAIENPNAKASDIIFTKEAINLNGQKATQGLPPFISSLLLPIQITDADTGKVINDEDIELCIGSSKTLVPQMVAGNNKTYEWFFDNGTTNTLKASTQNLTLSNLQTTDSGKYTLILKLTDLCGNITQYDGYFNMDVYKAASAKKPTDINFCNDTDGTTGNYFDLENLKSTEILDGLSPTTFNVLFFDDLTKANDNIAALPNPYEVNTASTQVIYARVHNKKAPNACFTITSFELEVTGLPKPLQPSTYRLCDDATSLGGDTDGITSNFDLSTKDSEILGTLLSPTQYNVSYHTTLADAQISSASNAIDKNADYQVTNFKTIYVRVENKDNIACNVISDNSAGSSFMSFQLIVDPLPLIKTPNPAQIRQCINTANGIATINLTITEINISDNANGSFEYYEDQSATQQILNATSYPIDANTNPPKSVWVKTISEFSCFRISELELIIGTATDEAYNETFITCDDFLDIDGNNTTANSDTDGITWFNLDSNTIIANINTNPNIDVFFYESTQDRDEAKNEITISNYRNKNIPDTTGNAFPIYYKLVNKVNNNCTGLGQIYLQIKRVPLVNIPKDLILCDDRLSGSTTDGENMNINLRNQVSDILGTTQIEADYIVSFHTSEAGANTNNDIIANDTNFTNSAPAGFTIGDISEQIIYARIEDRNGTPQCFNSQVSFKIIVKPIPAVSAIITPFAVCDIETLFDSDTRNRVAQNIDLTSKDSEILAGKINHRVAYYVTQQDAENSNEIANPTIFQNITSQTTFPIDFNTDEPGIEIIFFKIINEDSISCESIFATFQLLIYPEPNIPINISNYTDCDNTSDMDADDDNGKNGNISLKNKIPEILANYKPSEFADFYVSFYENLIDAESGNIAAALNENIFENAINNQTIYVRVENIKNTPISCVHTSLSFKINIKPLPDFTVIGEENIDDPQIVCLNDTPLTLEAENAAANYNYKWTDETGALLGSDAILNVTIAGKYSVTASDQSPGGCSRKRTIVVNASNVAILEERFITIIDESNDIGSNDNIAVSIDIISNNLGPGDYQFAIISNDTGNRTPFIGFQDDPLFENLEGGIYTLIVNDKKGCTPDTTLQISVLQFPKFFTPNGDGTNDTWDVKGANKTFYPNSRINIFNRFGKLVAQIPIDSKGWNGTYNGKLLPSDDYWYHITLIPADKTKLTVNKKGNFSLLRK